jgi:hypothetical protein
MTARAALLAAAFASASCGARPLTLPAGPGGPASDAGLAVAEATAACRLALTITADIRVSGSVGGRRLRGRIAAGLAAPSSARLEAVAPFGQPVFIFVATGEDAMLLFPREDRVLAHGRPDEVLEAVAGVPVDAFELRNVVTGCTTAPDVAEARGFGDEWRVVPDGPNHAYFRRDRPPAPWRLVATIHRAGSPDAWRAEYREFRDGLPRAIRLTSADPGRFDLKLSLSDVDVNMPLGPEVFRLQVPDTAVPMTLAELRQSGPLRADER